MYNTNQTSPMDQVRQELISMIHSKANTNPVRQYLYSVMSAGSYQNNEFNQLLETVLDYAEMISTTRNINPQTAIYNAVEVCTRLVSARLAINNTQVYNLVNFQQQQEIQNLNVEFDATAREIQNYKSRGQRNQMVPMNNHANQALSTGGALAMYGNSANTNQNSNNNYGAKISKARRSNGNDKSVSMGDYETDQNTAMDKEWNMNQVQPPTQPWSQPEAYGSNTSTTTTTPAESNSAYNNNSQTPTYGDGSNVDRTAVAYYPLPELKQVRAKYGKKGISHIPVFNANTQCCIIVVYDDDSVGFAIGTKEDEQKLIGTKMNYNQHAANLGVVNHLTEETGKVIPNWNAMGDEETVSEQGALEGVDYLKDVVRINSKVIAPNDAYAFTLINKKMKVSGTDTNTKDKIIEYGYIKSIPFVVDCDPELVKDFFRRISKSKSIDSFVDHVEAMLLLGIDTRLAAYVIKRATDALNTILSKRLDLSSITTNILADWSEMKTGLQLGNYDTGANGPKFLEIINESYEEIIHCVKPLDDNKVDMFIKQQSLTETSEGKKNLTKDDYDNLFLLGEEHYVSRVPWAFKDMELFIDPNGSAVKYESTPKLYDAIKGIHDRASKNKECTAISISLADNIGISLDSGMLSAGHFVISLIDENNK